MVRIFEIINKTAKNIGMDYLIDKPISDLVYKLYDDLLMLSNNYRILSYELDNDVMNEKQHQIRRIKDYVRQTFPPTSTVRKMIEEMYLYFDWHSE